MAVMTSSKTVVGVFDQVADANRVVSELENAGFSRDDISVVANKNTAGVGSASDTTDATIETSDAGSHVASDAGIGAALGGVGGLLLSFAGLAIPGIGPILAIGPIVAALSGAGIGAVAGGIVGALTESGVPEEEAHHYAEGVRRGHCLVTVRTDEANAQRAQQIMDQHGSVDVDDRVSNWRDRGWTQHEAGAEPLSADELRREREYYSAADRQGSEWTNEARDIGGSLQQTANRTGYSDDRSPSQTATRSASSSAFDNESTNTGFRNPDRGASQESLSENRSPSQASARSASSPAVDNVTTPAGPETGNPIYSDSTETAFRKPDRATVKVEQGFDRAMESAAQSARRLGSRIYDRNK